MTLNMIAQLEVKEGSFKEVPGFVNINQDENYQTDDNDLPFAVIKVRTENITDKQRRELNFSGNAGTFIVLEYKDGEVWVYLTAKYAAYLKISHPDFSSIEFTLPYDLEPKKGYEMTLANKISVDEDILRRLERLEALEKTVIVTQPNLKESDKPKFLSGKFSVSPDKQVYFSQGNIQYQPSTKTWRFAINQYDRIAEDNKNISLNYSGWIDLFGWGTGNNPINISKNESDYNVFFYWWSNFIINGGDDRNWRTLTKDEWIYLLDTRITQSGIRYVKAEVNGAVFLPAGGSREGVEFLDYEVPYTSVGMYWSSNYYNDKKASDIYFNTGNLLLQSKDKKYRGESVRLVCDVE